MCSVVRRPIFVRVGHFCRCWHWLSPRRPGSILADALVSLIDQSSTPDRAGLQDDPFGDPGHGQLASIATGRGILCGGVVPQQLISAWLYEAVKVRPRPQTNRFFVSKVIQEHRVSPPPLVFDKLPLDQPKPTAPRCHFVYPRAKLDNMQNNHPPHSPFEPPQGSP